MKDAEKVKARYVRDPLPRRLGGLAADLARIASSARHAAGADSVALMLEESQHFIEWTAGEAAPDVAEELCEIQLMLALWRRGWPETQASPSLRAVLSLLALKWSDQVLAHSGLLADAS